MRTDRELLEDALCLIDFGTKGGMAYDITREIRARLEEPEEDPCGYLVYVPSQRAQEFFESDDDPGYVDTLTNLSDAQVTPLYRHPSLPPVQFSDEELERLWNTHKAHFVTLREYKIVAKEVMDAMEKRQ